MGMCKKSYIPLVVSLILATMLHVAILTAVPFNGFNFWGQSFDRIISVNIEWASPHKPDVETKRSSHHKKIVNPEQIQNNRISEENQDNNLYLKNNTEELVNSTDADLIAENIPVEIASLHLDGEESQLEIVSIEGIENIQAASDIQKEYPQILKSKKEKLYFDIYWLGIYVGNAILSAVNDNGNIKIVSNIHSALFISTLFKVEDFAESHIINGAPVFFKIKQHEGNRRADKETFFDLSNKKITYVNNIKGKKSEHDINVDMLWDVMSGFYYMRTQKLNVGETLYINVFDSDKFYQAEVHILRKEKIKMHNDADKEIDTVVVKPVLKSEGLFQNKGNIFVWLTDDEARIPVKVETEAPIGRVIAEIRDIKIEPYH
ncbi:MAG: DUF3108 domain-containing protein [Thermodesulfovibrionales bacterium]|nr:DUF3108 domain-containing protein [Thermodesulfovibrionales bacterium]